MIAMLSLSCGSFLAGWILGRFLRPRRPRRRGSNPPPPGCKPVAPAGPPPPSPGIIPRPQMPPARVTDADGCTIGYQPLPQSGPDRAAVAAVRAADAAISDQALEAEFRAWWKSQGWPAGPGVHAVSTHMAWAKHLLSQRMERLAEVAA